MTTPATPTQYMVTKNTKFEAKLARYLISDPNDQLLGYDACIEKVGKTINYRLIVLGLESMYLPDNPPKPAQLEKPYIHYRDILRAEMIDDYPDFLFGNEKTNTLHMRLRVMMPINKSKKNKKKTKSTSVDEMHTIPSLFDQFTLENINSYMEPINPRRTSSNRDVSQVPLTQISAAIPLALTSTTTNGNNPSPNSAQQSGELSARHPSLEFKERLEDLNLYTDRSNIQRMTNTPRYLLDDQLMTSRSMTSRSASAKSSSSSKKKNNSDSDGIVDSPRFNRYMLQVHQDDRYGTLHTPRNASRGVARSYLEDDLALLTTRSTLTDLSYTSSMSLNAVNSEDSGLYYPSVEEVRSLQNDGDEDMKDIDIYFPSLNSKIPEILSAALSNYIVFATMRYSNDLKSSKLSNCRLEHSMDVTMFKFIELKTDILKSHSCPSVLAKLTAELCKACDKYAKVKDLFWKDHDLFVYYVAEFNACCQAIANNELDDGTIDLSFSIIKLFNEVFLNTLTSHERLARLTHDHCARIQILVKSLLTPPIALLSPPTDETTTTIDSEYNEMLKNTYNHVLNWMFMSVSLLWQIGDMLRRSPWTGEQFRFRHFIESFEKLQFKDEYFTLFIDALQKLIRNKERKDVLIPTHALYVYQFFSILSMLLLNSTPLAEYIRDQYMEEFKYFLKEELILSRIPVQYPVYRFMPDLIRDVHHRVLYGEPSLNTSERNKNLQLI